MKLKLTELPNSDLELAFWDMDGPDAQAEYQAEFAAQYAEIGPVCIYEALEPYSCNGSYAAFDAGDGNPFVGLSNAPCVAESLYMNDEGENIIEGRFWYADNYMITCPYYELAKTGRTVLTLCSYSKDI
jgi:hypothetical protein